jgi:hypothetical protein
MPTLILLFFYFTVGLLGFIGLSWLVVWWRRSTIDRGRLVFRATLLYTALFVFCCTGLGPFVGRESLRERMMTWEIKPGEEKGMTEAEVVLTYVDAPGHVVGEYSNELAAYLRSRPKQPVKVVIRVKSDYGKVVSFNLIEIDGLRGWKSEWGYSGLRGDGKGSPWN